MAKRNPQRSKDTKDQNQWVFVTEEASFEMNADEENIPTFCRLRHPKSEIANKNSKFRNRFLNYLFNDTKPLYIDEGAMFFFSHGNKFIKEVLQFKEEYRSWFIGDTVQQDGSLYLGTPVDPLYLILPYLIKAYKDGKFMQLDQLLHDEEFPESQRLCSCQGTDEIFQICDIKGADDFKVYRYNKDKTLSFLRLKVDRITDALVKKKIHVGKDAYATGFVKSSKDEINIDEFIRYAHGLLSDYLPLDLSADLREFMGIKEPVKPKPTLEEPPPKKRKICEIEPKDDYSKGFLKSKENTKEEKLTAAQKKLQKVDKSGMKSISSFFSAKPKK